MRVTLITLIYQALVGFINVNVLQHQVSLSLNPFIGITLAKTKNQFKAIAFVILIAAPNGAKVKVKPPLFRHLTW